MNLGGVPWIWGGSHELGGVLTEHGVQAHQAADEVVEIQVPPFVPIAAPQDPPELGGQPEPCRKEGGGGAKSDIDPPRPHRCPPLDPITP